MKNDSELKVLYRMQEEMYPSLSQKEIVSLYEKDGINFFESANLNDNVTRWENDLLINRKKIN